MYVKIKFYYQIKCIVLFLRAHNSNNLPLALKTNHTCI